MLTNFGLNYPIKALNPNSKKVGISLSEGQSYTVLSLELVIFKFYYYYIISFLVDTVFKESNDDSCLSSRFGERKLGRESVLD